MREDVSELLIVIIYFPAICTFNIEFLISNNIEFLIASISLKAYLYQKENSFS